jgi:mannose-6-phosphate isomerase-like protein (cupin superfamily)
MKPLAIALLLAGFAVSAGDPPGFYLWKAADLKAFSKSLAPKINDKKIATQPLGAFGNYSFMMAHREGNGEAEYHATQADILVVQSGVASIIIGGELVDGKTTAPNEMRASSIKGGEEKKLAAGDVVTIPPKVAHQMKMESGKEFTYFVVKVTQ